MRDQIARQQNVITIVKGYHRHTPVPDRAAAAGMKHRFAVVFHTGREDVDYMFFDAMLFCDVVERLSSHVVHDEMRIEIDGVTTLKEWNELRAKYLELGPEDRDPPRRIEYFESGQLSCIEETEFWVTCGGPPPYSDSYTASFFTRDDRTSEFARACGNACIPGTFSIIDASRAPLPWWRRMFS